MSEDIKVTALRPSAAWTNASSVAERYLAILSFLHAEDPVRFEEVILSLSNYSRVNFAKSREEIEQSGRSTLPKLIAGSQLWALTNLRNEQKQVLLGRILDALMYDGVKKSLLLEMLVAKV